MKKKFISVFVVILVVALLLCGCANKDISAAQFSSDASTSRYTKWDAINTERVIRVGQTEMIQLVVPINEYAKTVKVAWEISDESIATFAEEHNNRYYCYVVGLKPGEITIGGEVTAPDGNGSFSYKVIVEE